MTKVRIYDTKKRSFDDYDFQDLLQLQMVIANLADQGMDVEMINRNIRQEDFDSVPAIAALYKEKGNRGFPCLTKDGEIIRTGHMPSRKEILDLFQHDGDFSSMESMREDDGYAN